MEKYWALTRGGGKCLPGFPFPHDEVLQRHLKKTSAQGLRERPRDASARLRLQICSLTWGDLGPRLHFPSDGDAQLCAESGVGRTASW